MNIDLKFRWWSSLHLLNGWKTVLSMMYCKDKYICFSFLKQVSMQLHCTIYNTKMSVILGIKHFDVELLLIYRDSLFKRRDSNNSLFQVRARVRGKSKFISTGSWICVGGLVHQVILLLFAVRFTHVPLHWDMLHWLYYAKIGFSIKWAFHWHNVCLLWDNIFIIKKEFYLWKWLSTGFQISAGGNRVTKLISARALTRATMVSMQV